MKIKVIVVGCGDRATVYCHEGYDNLKQLEIVACVDPDPERLRYMRENFGVAENMCFTDINEVLKLGKIADAVINGTMDKLHLETALPFLRQGYHMLLEKPLVNNKQDLLLLKKTAEENGVKLMTCHVLRYAPFYRKIKELISKGEIGSIQSISTSERVGAYHSSVSYIRGKWNSEKECGSSLLLAKCCHDIDLLCWLNNSTEPKEVYSNGERTYFNRKNAPKGSGERCLVDCPKEIREKCIYEAEAMYIKNTVLPWYPWQCTGKNWQDVTVEEKYESLKTYNPHGRCIFKCDGDLLDHQNVAIKFANGSTANHLLVLGAMKPTRTIFVSGTEGEIEGDPGGELILRKFDKTTDFFTEEKITFDDKLGETGGHYGGDRGLVADFINYVEGKQPSISCTDINDSINGHLTVFAADESVIKDKPVVISE
ncbi:MAG: Gfo/Idh/MocA family oxidoreductase [Candidatus Borkfalkiaceae bacterium]|nr:Gfo/Idh/MocA family oxidoreductase [Christensenellaceae bacterium]